ncbi:MAG: hypothetical protein Q7T82_00015 [Armatimonadota bacterium]|nr:hypothetical protein [Armatimonadota bacterium]
MEIIRYAGHPTTISLFYNAIFALFMLIVVNSILKSRIPNWALSQGELLTVYIMINISSALVGHDFVQVLVPIMTHPFMYMTATDPAQATILHNVPRWLSVQDKDAVYSFYHGASTIYNAHHLRAWMVPALCWSGFIIAMMFVFLCANVLLRKQWTENEKLAYPLVSLPLDMTAEKSSLWRNKYLWIGFAIAASIDIINGLNTMYPNIPHIPIKLGDQGPLFTTKPWNGIGWLPTQFYPFGIAIGMLLPIDLLFSCWFFFCLWKAQLIAATYYGWNIIPGFPFTYEQSFGAYMGLALFAIMMSRKHFWNLIKHFFYRRTDLDDSGEAISYKKAMWGVLLGSVFLFLFSYLAGMSPLIILVFFAIYYALILAITRLRAELGVPAHDLHWAGPDRLIPTIAGPANISPSNLTMLSMFFWFNRAYRCHASPWQLEGFKIAERSGMNYKRLFLAMMFAIVFGTFVAFWANLHHLYKEGAATLPSPTVPLVYGSEAYNRLSVWLAAPTPPDTKAATAIGVGFAITMVVDWLRIKLPWFPLHPVGYAISGTWSMGLLWVSMFIAWLVKLLMLRYGGLKAYRAALPFFLGVILGECIVGGTWTLIGGLFNVPTYAFWP